MGQLLYSLNEGSLKSILTQKIGRRVVNYLNIGIFIIFLFIAGLVINFGNFNSLQPKAIEVAPIANFLDRDGHDKWRYLTLGFGDQIAWLAANTSALSVDGNYHSARRLPELTSRAVERLSLIHI